MAVKLNQTAYAFVTRLVREGRLVADERDDWSEHQPSSQEANDFIEKHGFVEYARWHLGTDDTEPQDRKGHYKFPYGDFRDVHRCGVLSAESWAGVRKYLDIEQAAAHLHGMIDEARALSTRRSEGERYVWSESARRALRASPRPGPNDLGCPAMDESEKVRLNAPIREGPNLLPEHVFISSPDALLT